ncbi:MAG: glycerophosphodiester phosphodiesterase [Cyanobacteria bacterium]|nr:glycerophosphodiester phosphodiesterase [Cyanobacteria bacterium GSL.Bin1]
MLKGFAVLPADTFAEGPPAGEGIAANGRTGPFAGQPVQGFSGVQFAPEGEGKFWFLSDNGFGSQDNSSDYLLRIYELDPNFTGTENGDGTVVVEDFIQLSDPNNQIPYPIVNEDTSERLLTGADFDIESFVIDANGEIWVGDEFGPFLLHFNAAGELLESPIPTPNTNELNTLNEQDPIVIAHRGASGDFPEHTLEAYNAAIAQGADFVEPDLAITSDGVLIARHEPTLAQVELDENGEILFDENGNPIVKENSTLTTNIPDLPQFADRLTVKNLDGELVGGWFAEDFTLEEIKENVRAVQSRDFRDPSFDGLFEIPTFQEVIELVQQVEADTGQEIGIYPETKHPTFFDEQGLSLEEPLIETLQETGFTDPNRIFIQSFEFQNLIELQGQLDAAGLGDLPLVQLYGNATASASPDSGFSVPYDIRFNVEQGNDLAAIYGEDFLDAAETPLSENTVYSDLDSAEFLQVISEKYAEGAGPWKNNILLREDLETPVDGDGDGEAEIDTQLTGEVTPFVDDAHEAGLQVHPYTLRDEEQFLTLEADGTPQTPAEEVEQLINIGVDGFFTDFPRTGDPVRDAMVAEEVRSPQNPDFDFNTLTEEPPLVIAHRGASGDFPEHTLEGYRAAILQGADFVEPDLVSTSDGMLIARHEPTLAQVELDENGEIRFDEKGDPIVKEDSTLTTNIPDLPQFADRLTVKNLDGELVGGWFAEDFTLEEIKENVRALQSRDFRDQSFNDEFEIPTFQEVIELVQQVEAETGVQVGIYPETKHPTFFDQQGLSLEEPLIQTLQETGFTDPSRIFIQSFEFQNLIELQETLNEEELGDLPLVQLYGNATASASPDSGFSVPYDIRFNVEQGNDLAAIYGEDFLDAAETPLSEATVYSDLDSPEFLQVISEKYAEGAGPWKNNFLLREDLETPVDGDGDGEAEITTQLTGEVTAFVDDAQAAGLQVHPYTLRNEERFLTLEEDGTPQTPGEEFEQLIEIGVDGFFTDFPATGSTVLEPLIEEPNLPRSRGFEGMAFSPDRATAYPLLEGSVTGDPDTALRIYEFDLTSGQYEEDIVGFYEKAEANHAIGDFTPINETEFLVIERDGGQAENAEFKKVFKVDFSNINEEGFVEKEEVVDLLNIPDPDDLNQDGETTYTMPFVTIEDVLVIDENTILVANDNNYPFSVGRPPEIDNNEIALIELEESLDLNPRLGANSENLPNGVTSPQEVIFGTRENDLFDGETGNNDFDALGDLLFAGAGNDSIDVSTGSSNRIFGESGDDRFFGGSDNRLIGGEGNDQFFFPGGGANNIVTGGADEDRFQILGPDFSDGTNTITDFTSEEDILAVAGVEASFADVVTTSIDEGTLISLNGEDLAILLGVEANSLSEADFSFG